MPREKSADARTALVFICQRQAGDLHNFQASVSIDCRYHFWRSRRELPDGIDLGNTHDNTALEITHGTTPGHERASAMQKAVESFRYQRLFAYLVAGAGFEPTTFGL